MKGEGEKRTIRNRDTRRGQESKRVREWENERGVEAIGMERTKEDVHLKIVMEFGRAHYFVCMTSRDVGPILCDCHSFQGRLRVDHLVRICYW